MRRLAILLVGIAALVSSACSACPKPALAAAAPKDCKPVYAPPCSGGNYDPANLPPYVEREVLCPFRGLGIPGLECPSEQPVSFTPVSVPPPCAPAVAAAPLPQWGHCGTPPPDAKPGEVWCCEFVQPPAAAPEAVCTCPASCYEEPVPGVFETVNDCVQVEEAKTEWQRVPCGDGSGDCFALVTIPPKFELRPRTVMKVAPSTRKVTIPAKFEMRASAPPPGFWEWHRRTDCAVPAVPQTSPCSPAAAAAPTPACPAGSPDCTK